MNMDPLPPAPMDEDGADDSGRTPTALVVDDDTEFLALVAPWLDGLGYHILTASDGKEAQGMMILHGIKSVDLLIAGRQLPRMRGDELVRWFIQENPEARALLLSAEPGGPELPAGALGLAKPCTRAVFLARINELLGQTDGTARA